MGHMYEKFQDSFNQDNFSYLLKKKFQSGVTVEIELYLEEHSFDGPMYAQVAMRSYTKRKQLHQPDYEFSIRGKDGLEPALWATKCLSEFPEFFFKELNFKHKDRLVYNIYWSDARRRDVYYKWLSRYGFFFDSSDGTKCLSKIYDR